MSACTAPIGGLLGSGVAKAPVTWSPGAEVPGWEDYDCPDAIGGEIIELGDMELTIRSKFGMGGYNTGHLSVISAALGEATCLDGGCTADGRGGVDGAAGAKFNMLLEASDGVPDRGQGVYGPEGTSSTRNRDPIGWWVGGYFRAVEHDPYQNSSASVCLSRVRPDELTGQLRLEYIPRTDDTVESPWYGSVILLQHFTFLWEPHSAEAVGSTEEWVDPPDGGSLYFNISYGQISYNDAWPWDEITDPDVRQRLWETYLPYNDSAGDG